MQGANFGIKDKEGKTPFNYAIENKDFETAEKITSTKNMKFDFKKFSMDDILSSEEATPTLKKRLIQFSKIKAELILNKKNVIKLNSFCISMGKNLQQILLQIYHFASYNSDLECVKKKFFFF